VAVAWATSLNVPLSKVLPSGTPFFFILLGIFYGMYRYVPHRPVYWKSALIAAFFTTCTWIIAKLGYGIYVRHFVGYGKIYGSLAAIPIFLVWVYLAWLVILMGAALSAALERHYLKGEAEDAEAKSLQPKT
jgi:membrane protein